MRQAFDTDSRRSAVILFVLSLALVLTAVWGVKWFVTQDGPAHLYNARILLEVRQPDAPLNQYYRAQWTPLPNLAGHVMLMGLMSILPARIADRILITLTFAGLACAVTWLRLKVSGWRSLTLAAPLSVLLALNWMWLMGFYSFLLGACLFAVTLGAWWAMRENFGLREAAVVAALLLGGYFCHIVSLSLTVIGLIVLALATPSKELVRRGLWTAASIVPLAPLVLIYRGLMQSAGESHPLWRNMSSLWSPRQWLMRWQAAETLQLSGRKFLPFIEGDASWHALFSPTSLAAIGLTLLVAATVIATRRERMIPNDSSWLHLHRGWILLASLLFVLWAVGPDDFGQQHGMYLRPRILLLTLVTLVPLLRFDLSSPLARTGATILAAALAIQIGWVWDYAVATNRIASELMRAQRFIGINQRVGTILLPEQDEGERNIPERSDDTERFTVHPLLHLDNLLGVETGSVMWNNYEAGYYMFPVKFREPDAIRRALDFDELNKRLRSSTLEAANSLSDKWSDLLARDHDEIDEMIIWGSALEVDAAVTRWYGPEPVFASGNVRVFLRRQVLESIP